MIIFKFIFWSTSISDVKQRLYAVVYDVEMNPANTIAKMLLLTLYFPKILNDSTAVGFPIFHIESSKHLLFLSPPKQILSR